MFNGPEKHFRDKNNLVKTWWPVMIYILAAVKARNRFDFQTIPGAVLELLDRVLGPKYELF